MSQEYWNEVKKQNLAKLSAKKEQHKGKTFAQAVDDLLLSPEWVQTSEIERVELVLLLLKDHIK